VRSIVGPCGVWGFEPVYANCELADQNWAGMPHTVYWLALGARFERLPLHLMSSTGCSLMQAEADEWVRETGNDVPVVVDTDVQPLDGFAAIDRVDLIKLDVEGAELDVLVGAAQTISRDRPFVICSYEHPSNVKSELIAALPGYDVRDDEATRLLTFSPKEA
jgi:FkbM family methyltransferase